MRTVWVTALIRTMASAICSVQRMPECDQPAVGEVFVIAHAGAVKVVGDSLRHFAFGSPEGAFW